MMRHPRRDPEAEVAKERAEKQHKLDARLATLSQAEKNVLAAMTEETCGDYTTLSRLAFVFLAGMPLADFSDALRNWSFSASLNGGYLTPHDEFAHLVQLNRIDWSEAREALLKSALVFSGSEVSSAGQWALVNILRATGDSGDAIDAETRVEVLTADWPKHKGWRLVERYCASDPCDPSAVRPDNIAPTAERYRNLHVHSLYCGRGRSEQDHFYDMARAGVVRFELETAVVLNQRFAEAALERDGMELRFALSLLKSQTAILSEEFARRLLEKARDCAMRAHASEERDSELWICGQYALLIALQCLSPQEQLEALLAYPCDKNILLEITHVLKTVDSELFAAKLHEAIASQDLNAQFRALTFAHHTDTPLSAMGRTDIAVLTRSPDAVVRMAALGVVAQNGDPDLVRHVADSDWSASRLDAHNARFEVWYGSRVIVAAAELGFLGVETALSRISSNFFGWAAQRLGTEGAHAVAARLALAIVKAIDFQVEVTLPNLEQRMAGDRINEPPITMVANKAENLQDEALAERLTESSEAFRERYKRHHNAFAAFEQALDKAGARLIIDNVRIEGFDAIATAEPGLAETWGKLFLDLPDRKLSQVHNIALVTARALARAKPDQAVSLFERLTRSEPHIHVTVGPASLSYDAVCMWSTASNAAIDQFLWGRLDRATNDHMLSMEVFAAERASKKSLVQAYVEDRLARSEPSWIARALMVAGFSADVDWAFSILRRFQDTRGLVGNAQAAACYALARHGFAKQWFEIMRATADPQLFWQAGILFCEVVDGRFVLDVEENEHGAAWSSFGYSMDDLYEKRIARWNSKRGEKLFGMKMPAPIFVVGL